MIRNVSTQPSRQVEPVQCLLVVDMQLGFLAGAHATPQATELVAAADELLARARDAGALVVFLRNAGPPGSLDEPGTRTWELYHQPAPGEPVVDKALDDGFQSTTLGRDLDGRGVQRLAICGVMSEMCVAGTARTALQRGYGVVLPHNAHGTYDIPAGPGPSAPVPASLAARAAEWALGDQIELVATAASVPFVHAQSGLLR